MILKDGIRSNRKLIKAGPEACWLWVVAIDYSRCELLDGFVPEDVVPLLAKFKDAAKLAERLVDAGLFERVDGGYQIHDFHDFNDSADTVRAKRARDLERKRNPQGFRSESARNNNRTDVESYWNPDGEKDARARSRERVGVGSSRSALKGHGSSTSYDPLSPSLWDIWRETGEAHGYPQPVEPRGGNLHTNVATIRGLVRDDTELRAALAAWWPSSIPKADQRTLGHFAGNLPSVLKHVRSGATGPWGADSPTPSAPQRLRDDVELQAEIARSRAYMAEVMGAAK